YTIGIGAIPCSKKTKRDLARAKVRLGLFDNAAEGFKCLSMSIDDRAHTRIEWHATKVLEPGHAHTLEIAVERPRESFSRLVDGKGCARIGPGDCAQGEGQVRNRTPQTARSTQCRPRERRLRVWHTADRRTEAHNVAKGGRIAQGAAGIGTS